MDKIGRPVLQMAKAKVSDKEIATYLVAWMLVAGKDWISNKQLLDLDTKIGYANEALWYVLRQNLYIERVYNRLGISGGAYRITNKALEFIESYDCEKENEVNEVNEVNKP